MGGANLTDAKQAAVRQLNRFYGVESGLNGDSEYVYAPYDKSLPGGAAAIPYVRRQFIDKSTVAFAEINRAFDTGLSPYSYEIVQGNINPKEGAPEFKEDLLGRLSHTPGNKPFEVIRTEHDGSKIKGRVMFRADQNSTYPVAGGTTSRSAWFQYKTENGNVIEAPISVGPLQPLRLQPDVRELFEGVTFSEHDLRMFEKATQRHKRAEQKVFDLRNENNRRPLVRSASQFLEPKENE